MRSNDPGIALHEAGHAVVALALGCRVDVVSIEPSDRLRGRCMIAPGATTTTAELAAFFVGGELSEAIWTGRPWSPHSPDCWHDTAGLIDLFMPVRAARRRGAMPAPDDVDALAAVPEFWLGFQLASAVIDNRRHEIHDLAERLLARGTLRNLTN